MCLIYSQENNGKDVLFSAVADMWLTTFSKETPSQKLFYENCDVLQKVIFTEHCCATASNFVQHFQFITCLISNKSVFIHS